MDDLIAFVKARLDEDEMAARNAGGETWDFTGTNCEVRVRPSGRKGHGDFGRVIAYTRHGNPVTEDLALSIHVSWQDPARALREVAAKRAILAMHMPAPFWGNNPPPRSQQTAENAVAWYCECQCPDGVIQGEYPCDTTRHIAAVWSDHADYRQEWKP